MTEKQRIKLNEEQFERQFAEKTKDMILIDGEAKELAYAIITKPFNGGPFCLLKYCEKEEFAQDVVDGKLYVNTAQYFIDLEKQSGKRGQGDAMEMTCPLPDNENIEITIDPRNGQPLQTFVFPITPMSQGSISIESDKKMLIYSKYWLSFPSIDDVRIYKDDKIYTWTATLTLPPIEEDKYKFGVIIQFQDFINKVRKYFVDAEIDFFAGKVEYASNTKERLQAFIKNDIKRFFYKEEYFKNHNEFRVVICMDRPDDGKIHLTDSFFTQKLPLPNIEMLKISIGGDIPV